MTQARFSGPRWIALQFSASAVDENAAEKPDQFPLAPMGILARGIKLPNVATVQRSHDTDAREYRWSVMLRDQRERLHGGPPFFGIVFCLGQFGHVLRGIGGGGDRGVWLCNTVGSKNS